MDTTSEQGTQRNNKGKLAPSGAELNLGIVLRMAACWIEDTHGKEKLAEVAAGAGMQPSDLDGKSNWGTLEQAESFYESVYELVGRDDRAFVDVNGYKVATSMGPVRFLIRTLTPKFIFEKIVKEFHVCSVMSRLEMVKMAERSCIVRYKTTKPESRLSCLSRQGVNTALPTIWGLPKAECSESACVAWGDEYCEYHFSWNKVSRNTFAKIGAALGIVTGLAGYLMAPWLASHWVATALVLPLLGYLFDLSKSNREMKKTNETMTAETQEILRADALTRREMSLLNERQREWERVLTRRGLQASSERATLARQMTDLQNGLKTNIRGLSHDINAPLAILKMNTQVIKSHRESLGSEELDDILNQQEAALAKIAALADRTVKAVKGSEPIKNVEVQEIDLDALGQELSRRVKALVHSRPIVAAVVCQDALPKSIATDRMLFDRIVDNLLFNAAKYTSSGRIEVHLSCDDDEFSLDIRDTGRGITPEEMSNIFVPGGSSESAREPGSRGVGLSIVVLLLAQLGGRLFVSSTLNKGSSFKCVLPLVFEPGMSINRDMSLLTDKELIHQIVTIVSR